MPLEAGTHLGPYEILSPLGAGGMGEVYKARDTRLDRTVAIKVLPEHVAADPGLKQRFEREARTVAALNHPHICTLYDIGQQDGTDFLVMEYLEGETLAARLAKGPLPTDQVLRYATEIADALDKAHRKGITHRDLKPGNVMITKAGTKLLDFGLAKLKQPAPGTPGMSAVPTQSAALTMPGTILGTLQYMAPEQLEGKDADHRTDIFAFGAVLYEMATGKKAFEGKSQATLIAAIISNEPAPISTLQHLSPPALDRLVAVCLAKNPDDRWQTARDLFRELRWIEHGAGQGALEAPPVARAPVSRWLAWAMVAVLAVLSLLLYVRDVSPDAQEFRLDVTTPPTDDPVSLAISPDGTQLVFVARSEGASQLWLRTLDSTVARPLPGTEGAGTPFWSPDGHSVGFFTSEQQLKRLDLAGGSVQTLRNGFGESGASWGASDEILFGDYGGIFSIPASGGDRTLLIQAEAGPWTYRFPAFLPGGADFLYWVVGVSDDSAVYVGSMDGSRRKRLLPADGGAVYVPPGYLAFVRQGTLYVQQFDPRQLVMQGEPFAVGQVATNFWGQPAVSASGNGTLVYRSGAATANELAWFDRAGNVLRVAFSESMISGVEPELSPNGTQIAFTRVGSGRNADVWLLEEARGGSERLTFDSLNEYWPVWSPDGTRVAFGSDRSVPPQIYVMPSDKSSPAALSWESADGVLPADWSPDGDVLLYQITSGAGATGYDLWAKPLGGDEQPFPVASTPFHETHGQFSPDGRWVAYQSNESGRSEIHVKPFPGPGGQQQVSIGGGVQPRWRADGRELFYIGLDSNLMGVGLEPTPGGQSLQSSTPRALFRTRITGGGALSLTFKQMYDVSPDGQTFLISVTSEEATASPITVILNWNPESGR